jgi:ATP-binding cassette, subfamily B, heavy metal transporter
MTGCTTLIFARRLSTVMHADESLVLDGGRIVQQATHADLIARGHVSARLPTHQQVGVHGLEQGLAAVRS